MELFLLGIMVALVVTNFLHKTPAQQRRMMRNAHRFVFGTPKRAPARRARKVKP